jgi:two-component system, OmpR family, response regulator BaeR
MKKEEVLVVEDDNKIAALLSDYLKQANFNVSILRRGDVVTSQVRSKPPDVILLDIMLPGKDGMTICQEIRSFSKVPILILSARVEEIDRLLGLELGADDYICKPFSPRELVARIKAVLRRNNSDTSKEILVAGPITINSDNHEVKIRETYLHLTPNEFELLRVLVSRPGYVFKRSDLISEILGNDFDGFDRIIDSHIKNLRKKIDKILPGNKIVHTVYGIGYAYNAPDF